MGQWAPFPVRVTGGAELTMGPCCQRLWVYCVRVHLVFIRVLLFFFYSVIEFDVNM